MTVATSTSRSGPYAGAGTTGPFTVGFRFLENSHLSVIQTSAAGTETTLALNTDYTLTGAGSNTGTVTLVTALPVGETLSIVRNVPITQLTDYVAGDAFPADSHEDALDKLTMIAQQLQQGVDQSLRVPESADSLPMLPAVADRKNRIAGFDTNGNPVAVVPTDGTSAALATDLLASDTAAHGAGQVGYGATPAYAAGTVGAKLREAISVKDYGAVGDWNGTTGTDDTGAIQAAIDAANALGGADVLCPGRFKTTAPLLLYGGVRLVGPSELGGTGEIAKTTNTVGTGTSRARTSVTDSYAVDSIVSIWHADTASGTLYAYNSGIEGIRLTGIGNTYGIFAPRISQCTFERVLVMNVGTAFLTYDAWMCTHTRCTAQAVQTGWKHADDGSGIGAGTSAKFDNCWVNFDNSTQEPSGAFDLFGLKYSSLLSCGADNLTRTDNAAAYVYTFNSSAGIVMVGCGAESGTAGILWLGSSSVTVVGFNASAMAANASWPTVGGLFVDSSKLVAIGCEFGTYSPGTGVLNLVLQAGSTLTNIDSTLPTGGSGFVSYSAASRMTTLRAGQLSETNAGGTANVIPLIGSATFDPASLADGAGATTTVTVTGAVLGDYASASFSLDLQGVTLTAWVSAADTVSVRLQNESGGALDLGSGTLRARVVPQ